jgi:Flp pilus assembly protein TadG
MRSKARLDDTRQGKQPSRHDRKSAGYILITLAVMAVVLVASIGMAMDFGTAFVVRNETQAYCDSAALAASLELDGTAIGVERARQRAMSIPNQWLFSSSAFQGVVVEFAQDPGGPWSAAPGAADGFRFVRVAATASAPMSFLPIVTNDTIAQVQAEAVAGQVEKTQFTNGVFPFSPFAHNANDPNFGFSPGTLYTLLWPNNMNQHANICPGDEGVQHVLDMKEQSGPNIQGYIDSNSAAAIRNAIVKSEQSGGRVYTVGDPIFMSNGNKQSMDRAMQDRVRQDTDTTSATYADYLANYENTNGRRLVIVPVNEGPATNFRLAGFGLFFLRTAEHYDNRPRDSYCAEYVGSAVLGSNHRGADSHGGAFAVRLVR